MKKLIFCANCQKDTEQLIEVLPDYVLASCECGRQLKFPPLKEAGAFRELLGLHKIRNIGQVPATQYVPDAEVLSAIENA